MVTPKKPASLPAIYGIGHNQGPPLPPLPTLTAIELEQHLTVERAAELLNVHIETFEATYPHLIRRVSPRCRRVKLRDLLSEQRVQAA
jgi:hypothetical protein